MSLEDELHRSDEPKKLLKLATDIFVPNVKIKTSALVNARDAIKRVTDPLQIKQMNKR